MESNRTKPDHNPAAAPKLITGRRAFAVIQERIGMSESMARRLLLSRLPAKYPGGRTPFYEENAVRVLVDELIDKAPTAATTPRPPSRSRKGRVLA